MLSLTTSLHVITLPKVRVVSFECKRIDGATLMLSIGLELTSFLIEGGPLNLVLDCTKVTFMDSEFIWTLVLFNKKLTGRGGKLAFFGLSPSVAGSFRTKRLLGRCFMAYQTLTEAINSLSQ